MGIKLIIVQLVGGLGNQMFQYAAAKALSLRLDIPLGLDTFFVETKEHPHQLSNFNIKYEMIPRKFLPPRKNSNYIYWKLWKLGIVPPKIFHQNGLRYDPQINQAKKNTYLIGYWQSEKFFLDYKNEIRSDFTFNIPLTGKNLEIHQEILETPSSISLHIRRGDYLSVKNFAIHGSCSQFYYQNAVTRISASCSNTPTIFVFSDEPSWVSENLKLSYPVKIIGHNLPDKGIEDLRLMTICDHHVIANSTFSWWGAWLSKSENGLVVAPSRWFTSSKLSNPDIYCDHWIQIQN